MWNAVVYVPLDWLLGFIYAHVQGVSVVAAIGAYGVAIIILTVLIRLLLSPLQQFQLVRQRRSMVEQRKLAPQVAELRKKYKKDAAKLNSEMMKLYQEHGVNPLSGLVGCLPLVVQMPILYALYYVFTGFPRTHHNLASHFLFVPNLNENPTHHPWFALFGFSVPTLVYLVFPLCAAVTTLIQSRMLQMPPAPNPTDQELQTMQMQKTMVWLSPVMIGVFALNVPAGLGLYWFIGNCVSIIQQSFVVGWGNLLPSRFRPVGGTPPATPPKQGPAASPSKPKPSGPLGGPNQPRLRPANGSNQPHRPNGNGKRRRR